MVDPQIQRLLENFRQDPVLFVHDTEDAESMYPGINRATDMGVLREIPGSGFDTGTCWILTRLGEAELGIESFDVLSGLRAWISRRLLALGKFGVR